MSKPQLFKGKYFVWKLEGTTVTIQAKVGEVLPSLKEFFVDNRDWLLKKLREWKQQGYKTVEFWVPPECHTFAKPWFAKEKIRFEVVRLEEDGRMLCRLLL